MADGVGYRQAPLYLSDQELMKMAAAMNAILAPVLANEPAPERRLRVLTASVMPWATDQIAEEHSEPI